MYTGDTIAAIATALSPAGINIIRISGDKAFSVTSSVFRSARGKNFSDIPSGTVTYGFVEYNGEVIDEVMMLKMAAPHTYTREDVTEIHTHGGILVTKRVLEAILAAGARLAESGEFTKRAFLNGRIDLSQAEAVMDIIGSGSDLARKNSMRQLRGDLRAVIDDIREKILQETAYIEAALDDPEHISLDGFIDALCPVVDSVLARLTDLLYSFETGKIIRDGLNVVIAGRPNAGKSSLLNALLKEERAIVTSVAGTTRDTISESLDIGGLILNLTDTAGIRRSDDLVESIGIDRARKAANEAQLILYLIDTPLGITEEDNENLKSFAGKRVILIYNKDDLVVTKDTAENNGSLKLSPDASGFSQVRISALTGDGIEELKAMIKNMFLAGSLESGHDILITNVRHAEHIREAINSLELVRSGIREGVQEDLLSIDLIDAYKALGMITGEEYRDDLADKIFSSFCMGK
ncbi:MAG: tRNA uridine-5-carboxymethylaminomethyl(34) synthesis GTPase MnmE [Lachnospiraceae bacterium]|nr:tRNA uridine-5-carboxymethylaminomethyl(34) synthesis GTPase MnmE [Lachnospiraceae bacterium]